jgi:2'-5' RNA ligase
MRCLPCTAIMGEGDNVEAANSFSLEERERFRNIRQLRNHWSRPIAPRSYYWYLTFENHPELHSLATQCQKVMAFPYYDLTPLAGLHLTLDRISFYDEISSDQLRAIELAAMRSCRGIQPFAVGIGPLGGTPGAIGFSIFPSQPIQNLRDTFRQATLSVCPDAPVKCSTFHPHIAIAYANSDGVLAAEAVASAEKLNDRSFLEITIDAGTLVLLERHQRSYDWRTVSRVRLGVPGAAYER